MYTFLSSDLSKAANFGIFTYIIPQTNHKKKRFFFQYILRIFVRLSTLQLPEQIIQNYENTGQSGSLPDDWQPWHILEAVCHQIRLPLWKHFC